MRMAPEVAQPGHWQIDEDTVNAGKRVDRTIAPFVLPCEERLCNFDIAGKGGKEGGGAAGVTIAEGLAARVESSLVWIANVEVANEETDSVWVRRPVDSRSAKPLAKFLQRAVWLVMKVNDRAVADQLPNPHEVLTSRENFLMLNQRAVHISKGKRAKTFPSIMIQHSISIQKVRNSQLFV